MQKVKIALFAFVISGSAVMLSFHAVLDGVSPSIVGREPFRETASLLAVSVGQSPRLKFQSGFSYLYSYSRSINFQGFNPSFEPVSYDGKFLVQTLNADSESLSALISERGMTLKIDYTIRSQVLRIYSSRETRDRDLDQVSILRDLISLWLFQYDSDTVGKYIADYSEETSADSVAQVRKIKRRYVNVDQAPVIVKSNHLLSWNPSLGIPLIIEGSETTEMPEKVAEQKIIGESNYRIQLASVESKANIRNGSTAPFTYELPLELMSGEEQESSREKHPLYARIQWEELKQKLINLEALTENQRLKIFGELMRALRIGKAQVSDAVSLIWNGDILKQGSKSALFRTVVGALASSGTPEAQASIIQVYQSQDLSTQSKGSILTSLTTMSAPLTIESQEFLARTARSESNQDLSVGAGFALSGTKDAAKSPIVHEFIQNEKDPLVQLDMIGNSGDIKFLNKVGGLARDVAQPVDLRSKAVFALRFMDDSEAQATLNGLLQDSTLAIREAALDAMELAHSKDAFHEALVTCAQSEKNARLRERCEKLQ